MAPSANTLVTIYRPGLIRCLVAMSLCFLKAFQEKQEGNITEQEYLHHLFVHSQGVKHEGMTGRREIGIFLRLICSAERRACQLRPQVTRTACVAGQTL